LKPNNLLVSNDVIASFAAEAYISVGVVEAYLFKHYLFFGTYFTCMNVALCCVTGRGDQESDSLVLVRVCPV